jgi:purine-binding chemotaxis protein CheW
MAVQIFPLAPFFDCLSPVSMSETEPQKEDLRQFVSFVIAGEEFGVNILTVQEIIRPVEITRVPHAPDFVEGVINLRGRILPVIDLRTRFGFPSREQDDDMRIVVVEIGAQTIGFMTDSVQEVLRVDVTSIEPAPEIAVGIDAGYLRGVAKLEDRLLILLELENILSADEAKELQGLDQEQPEAAATAQGATA